MSDLPRTTRRARFLIFYECPACSHYLVNDPNRKCDECKRKDELLRIREEAPRDEE